MIQIASELLAGDFLKLALSQRRYCQWGNAHGRATPPDTRSHQSRPEPAPAPLVACSSGGARKRVLTPSARARATTNGGLSSGKNCMGGVFTAARGASMARNATNQRTAKPPTETWPHASLPPRAPFSLGRPSAKKKARRTGETPARRARRLTQGPCRLCLQNGRLKSRNAMDARDCSMVRRGRFINTTRR